MKLHESYTSDRVQLLWIGCIAMFVVGIGLIARQALSGGPSTAVVLITATAGQQAVPPEKVVGREQCKTCHESELAAWQASAHATKAWGLLSHPKAPDFAKALGITQADIKTSVCTECHGTKQMLDGQLVIAQGNSCESCHGGAGGENGWLTVHCDYGDGIDGKTMAVLLKERTQETPAHREARLAACSKAGMNRSQDALEIAMNCLHCHIVPDEKLIEAGHPSSDKFEFVEWAQGEVRHNFLLDPNKNAEAPSLWLARDDSRTAEGRKRLMFIVGQLADLEVSLRTRANVTSTKRGSLGDLLNDRIEDAIDELKDLEIDDLEPVLDAIEKNKIDKKTLKEATSDDKAIYRQAADDVRAAAEAFLEKHKHGDQLSEIKVPTKAKGDVFKE